jgi:hypothetical protein
MEETPEIKAEVISSDNPPLGGGEGAVQVALSLPYQRSWSASARRCQVIDTQTLPRVQMPNRDGFIPRFPDRPPK